MQNLVINGDFEIPGTGIAAFLNWNNNRNVTRQARPNNPSNYCAYFQVTPPPTNGTLSQTIYFRNNKSYLLNFELYPLIAAGTINISFTKNNIQIINFVLPLADESVNTFTLKSLEFLVPMNISDAILTISTTDANFYIDNVSIVQTQVPNFVNNASFDSISQSGTNLFTGWTNNTNVEVSKRVYSGIYSALLNSGGVLSQSNIDVGLTNVINFSFFARPADSVNNNASATITITINNYPTTFITDIILGGYRYYTYSIPILQIDPTITIKPADYNIATLSFQNNEEFSYLLDNVVISTVASPNYIYNPGFEIVDSTFEYPIVSWISTGPVIATGAMPHSGTSSALIYEDGNLSQNVFLPRSGTYVFSFYIAMNTQFPNDGYVLVSLNREDLFIAIIPSCDFMDNSYRFYTYTVNIPSPSTNVFVSFSGIGSINYYLDDVSITKNIIKNPSFEYITDGNIFENWMQSAVTPSSDRPFTGNNSALFSQPFIPQILSQDITFDAAGLYEVNFYINPLSDSGSINVSFTNGIQPTSITILARDYTPFVYNKYTFIINVPVSNLQSKLTFTVNNIDVGLYLDDVSINFLNAIICYRGDSIIHTRNIQTGVIAGIPAKNVYSGIHEVYSTKKHKFIPILLNIVSGPTSSFCKIDKDSLGVDKPNTDFYITPGHVIMHNGVPTKARDISVAHKIKHEPEMVYSICVDKSQPILVNGLETFAWGYNDWLKRARISGINWKNNNINTLNVEPYN